MGNKATKAFNNLFPVVSRAVKNYNFTDRAERAITKDKRPTAPRHSSTVDILDKFSEEHPEFYDAQKEKNKDHVERLKQVHVDSHGTTKDIQSKRSLPEITKDVAETEMGFIEPEYIPPGKVMLKDSIKFIVQHQKFASKYTAEEIAKEYKLDAVQVENVLKHFQTFQLHLSKETFKKNPKLEKLLKSQSKSEFVYNISPTTELPSQKQLPDSSVEKDKFNTNTN